MRKRKSLFWLIFSSHLIIALLSVAVFAGYARRELRDFDVKQTMEDLETRSRMYFEIMDPKAPLAQREEQCVRLGREGGARLTVLTPDGVVLLDSEKDPSSMENHSIREEIRAAVAGKVGRAIRWSETLKLDMLYVAVPFPQNELPPKIIVRSAKSLGAFEAALEGSRRRLWLVAAAVGLTAMLMSYFVGRRIAGPLEDLRRGVERLSRGEQLQKLPLPNAAEPAVLAAAINRMAEELDTRLREEVRRRAELQAVLRSMTGGVVAMDVAERIVFCNKAAEDMLCRPGRELKGRFVQEVVRHVGLCDFLRQAAQSGHPMETDLALQGLALHDAEERYYQVRSAPLVDAMGKHDGVLVVLNDMTTLYRLEQVRRDFVANASHELKTPITAIRGFAETLLDSEQIETEQRKQFLEIILRQTGRLQALIEDLLMLSRLENSRAVAAIPLTPTKLLSVAQAAVQTCGHLAEEKRISVSVDCGEELVAMANPELLERALVNLVGNAVKYSPEGTAVRIEGRSLDARITLSVQDQGPGIPKEHLERIFERFYRVDKARSRQLGGTGLGLSIAKHIALLHRGQISVESEAGEGSRFILSLPAMVEGQRLASCGAPSPLI
jgi:two-component system phosphate regulon sensor histidine kinase PhoR